MLEKLKETLTLVGVLRRLLVTLVRVDRSLASLADSQKLALKIQLLERGSTEEELRSMSTLEGEGEVDIQEEAEFAEMDRQEAFLRSRGHRVDEDSDLGILHKSWLEAEGKEGK